jgi:hypothetical protein
MNTKFLKLIKVYICYLGQGKLFFYFSITNEYTLVTLVAN